MNSVSGNQSDPNDDKHRVSGLARYFVAAGVTAVLALAAMSCSGALSTSNSGNDVASTPAERGRNIAGSRGCSGCHGSDFNGGAGPSWVGLAGSEVELTDGSFVLADDAYLVRAIGDPGADQRANFSLRMPSNNLSNEDIADVVEFIKSLNANDE